MESFTALLRIDDYIESLNLVGSFLLAGLDALALDRRRKKSLDQGIRSKVQISVSDRIWVLQLGISRLIQYSY